MDNDNSELRWGVEQRLEFIRFRLFWEGRVNRSDLKEQFELSVNQTFAHLNRYIGFVPDNMVHDRTAQIYVQGQGYVPCFLKAQIKVWRARFTPHSSGSGSIPIPAQESREISRSFCSTRTR